MEAGVAESAAEQQAKVVDGRKAHQKECPIKTEWLTFDVFAVCAVNGSRVGAVRVGPCEMKIASTLC